MVKIQQIANYTAKLDRLLELFNKVFDTFFLLICRSALSASLATHGLCLSRIVRHMRFSQTPTKPTDCLCRTRHVTRKRTSTNPIQSRAEHLAHLPHADRHEPNTHQVHHRATFDKLSLFRCKKCVYVCVCVRLVRETSMFLSIPEQRGLAEPIWKTRRDVDEASPSSTLRTSEQQQQDALCEDFRLT